MYPESPDWMASCSAAEQNLYTLLSFRPTATTTRNTCSSRASLHPYLVRYTFPAFDWPRKKRRRRRKKRKIRSCNSCTHTRTEQSRPGVAVRHLARYGRGSKWNLPERIALSRQEENALYSPYSRNFYFSSSFIYLFFCSFSSFSTHCYFILSCGFYFGLFSRLGQLGM